MKKNYPYLKDFEFLNMLYGQHNKTTYANITVLDWAERPIQPVEARIISASCSINGDSAVRRTANLSVKILRYDELYTNVDSLFSINKKIFLETGLKNNLAHLEYYPDYETIWFPFGVMIITACSVTHDLTGITVNLSLSDKMVLLNGTVSGVIPASTNFESVDDLGPDGDLHSEYLKINRIIPEMVNHFGGEDLNHIIVSDVPDQIKQVLKWVGSNPLYLCVNNNNSKNAFYTTIQDKSNIIGIEDYTQYKFTHNYDCGYTYTDFVYPGELGAGAGDSVCTILDKIKQTLGNYEYYYDVFGNFIFQEIKNYVNTSEWRTLWYAYLQEQTELPYAYNTVLQANVYDFSKTNFVINYSNTPKFDMVKNDFIVWGSRTNSTGLKLPCRYHLAIDKKPRLTSNLIISTSQSGGENHIYTEQGICFDTSMNDYIKKAHIIDKSYSTLSELQSDIPQGIVGKYYRILNEDNAIYSWVTDVEGYKNLIQNYLTAAKGGELNTSTVTTITNAPIAGYVKLELATYYSTFTIPQNTDWRNLLYWQGLFAEKNGTDTGLYWAELCNEWPKVYDVENCQYYPSIINSPSTLDWWLDIIDADATLNKFSIDSIGKRSYAKTDEGCNCVFETFIPDVIMVDWSDDEQMKDVRSGKTRQELLDLGLLPVQVSPSIARSTVTGGTLNSCYEHVKQILNDYTNYNETINFTCIPIYHLEPNTRVHLDDPESGIYGDYIINTISFSLGDGGAMSISATKVIEKI